MTVVALNQLIHATPGFLQRLGHSIATFLDGISEARAMAERFKTLSRMTDSQLAQHGLKREEIPQAVLGNFGRN